MNDLNALLRAVITSPDDDTVRFAYADCLDELPTTTVTCPVSSCGNPAVGWDGFYRCRTCKGVGTITDTSARDRAEFIRVQVELSSLDSPVPNTNRVQELAIKENEMLKRCSKWFAPVGFTSWPRCSWSRGFVTEIECSAEDFLAHAEELVWHPTHTMKCEQCRGRGYYGSDREHCVRCKGTGYMDAPRPCPDTAQPIRCVVLTMCEDWDTFLIDNQFSVLHVDGCSVWSSPNWPDVKFKLPIIRDNNYTDSLQDSYPYE